MSRNKRKVRDFVACSGWAFTRLFLLFTIFFSRKALTSMYNASASTSISRYQYKSRALQLMVRSRRRMWRSFPSEDIVSKRRQSQNWFLIYGQVQDLWSTRSLGEETAKSTTKKQLKSSTDRKIPITGQRTLAMKGKPRTVGNETKQKAQQTLGSSRKEEEEATRWWKAATAEAAKVNPN